MAFNSLGFCVCRPSGGSDPVRPIGAIFTNDVTGQSRIINDNVRVLRTEYWGTIFKLHLIALENTCGLYKGCLRIYKQYAVIITTKKAGGILQRIAKDTGRVSLSVVRSIFVRSKVVGIRRC